MDGRDNWACSSQLERPVHAHSILHFQQAKCLPPLSFISSEAHLLLHLSISNIGPYPLGSETLCFNGSVYKAFRTIVCVRVSGSLDQ